MLTPDPALVSRPGTSALANSDGCHAEVKIPLSRLRHHVTRLAMVSVGCAAISTQPLPGLLANSPTNWVAVWR
jgi:hypothetical protein